MARPDYDLIVIGGGAAGFFTALRLGELCPQARILILEQGKEVLGKVKVSGGGRCNVTHACYDPRELCHFYPRGSKELVGPFHRFAPGDIIAWFDERRISLKTEEDGRMFPTTDSSQTIIDCFLSQCRKLGIEIRTRCQARSIRFLEKVSAWQVQIDAASLTTRFLLVAPGSSKRFWGQLKDLGHEIVDPVPSLFTFNIPDKKLHALAGTSMPVARVEIPDTDLAEEGPILITHWGLSGPAILKLSSVGARILHGMNYRFAIRVNWVGEEGKEVLDCLRRLKASSGGKKVFHRSQLGLSQRLWKYLVDRAGISPHQNWADLKKEEFEQLSHMLSACPYQVSGKSTFKEEFVTAGGVDLQEVDLRRFESKLFPQLYFAGEVLNIDALTGGFNFQAAWTGGWIAGTDMAGKWKERD
jgi:hypothetical protein